VVNNVQLGYLFRQRHLGDIHSGAGFLEKKSVFIGWNPHSKIVALAWHDLCTLKNAWGLTASLEFGAGGAGTKRLCLVFMTRVERPG
jgi:hypothetical protein